MRVKNRIADGIFVDRFDFAAEKEIEIPTYQQ